MEPNLGFENGSIAPNHWFLAQGLGPDITVATWNPGDRHDGAGRGDPGGPPEVMGWCTILSGMSSEPKFDRQKDLFRISVISTDYSNFGRGLGENSVDIISPDSLRHFPTKLVLHELFIQRNSSQLLNRCFWIIRRLPFSIFPGR